MKRFVGLWQLSGFAVTAFVGTLLHFLYDWLGEAPWIAPFSGVNESTWEHMKLFFWPAFLFAVVQSFFFRERKNFWCIKRRGTLLGLFLIPILFYTYNGAIGPSPDWFNIAIFFISVLATYVYEGRLLHRDDVPCRSWKSALGTLCAIAVLFLIFTFQAPHIGIFKDPLTSAYGI